MNRGRLSPREVDLASRAAGEVRAAQWSPTEWRAMRAILGDLPANGAPESAAEICKRLGWSIADPTTIRRVLARLVRVGIFERYHQPRDVNGRTRKVWTWRGRLWLSGPQVYLPIKPGLV